MINSHRRRQEVYCYGTRKTRGSSAKYLATALTITNPFNSTYKLRHKANLNEQLKSLLVFLDDNIGTYLDSFLVQAAYCGIVLHGSSYTFRFIDLYSINARAFCQSG